MNIGCVIVVGVLLTAELSECLECFNCQNIVDPHACTTTSQCSNGQSCYVQSVHNGNDELFNMGCQSNQLCSSSGVDAGAIIGRSIQRRQHYACHECCSTNSCNGQLCAHRTPSSCVDDPTLDCARLDSLFNVCADIHRAKATCRRFCGLCSLVDGNWSEWATWTACSVTCQNGTKTRARSCTNPSPSNGGLDCSGTSDQNEMCSNPVCPVHGNWTDWSTWSGCSVTCDVGLRDRIRTCSNPKPDRNGDNCIGNPSEYTVCLTDPCYTRNGGWSNWGSWQSCSVTCGVGHKLRDRTCTNPSPSAYGKACEGNTETFAVCENRPCTGFVGFSTELQTKHEYYNNNTVIKFDYVHYNEGGHYSPSTGIFTVPVSGVFVFLINVEVEYNSSDTNRRAHVVLYVNGSGKTEAIVKGIDVDLTGGNAAVVKVSAGDRVYVSTANVRERYYIWSARTSFSGALLHVL